VRISIIGCGYVGLVTGVCLADIGHQVVCTDSDAAKIAMLLEGKSPIYEPHLGSLLSRNRRQGRIEFTSDFGRTTRDSEAIFICVGTPPLENGDADLSAVENVARLIAAQSHAPKLIIEKSTVPIASGQQLKRVFATYGRNPGASFTVASNPEFLREGSAVMDFFHPTRIVIGIEDGESERRLREIYRPILERKFRCPVHQGQCPNDRCPPFMVTTLNSAELIKHAANCFLALKISYANLIADLCEQVGADVDEIMRAVGLDPRIGPEFLSPGLGFGGFCLPKDLQAFIRLGEYTGLDFSLLKEAEVINRGRVSKFLEMARRALWVMKGKRVGILGLAFKPNTDDIRFAPALELIRRLLQEGVQVRAFDPASMARTRAIFDSIDYCSDAYQVAADAEAVMIVTEWEEFKTLDWRRVRDSMLRPLLLDGRNLLDPAKMKALGFEYYSIGRPTFEHAIAAFRQRSGLSASSAGVHHSSSAAAAGD